jgi:ABC-type multidrug transport system ATPase subunit
MTACDFDVVTVHDVSRAYGRRRALSHASLECRAGSITGVFGPNGAGKSTLIGVLATALTPQAGAVRYGDRTAAQWGDVLRGRIGLLGHDLFLYNELTARENLAFFATLYGVADVPAVVARALDQARLVPRADDRAGSLSRGLRQRLALERALVQTPRLILLDEPFTGLDDESAGVLVARLRALRAAGGVVVMATHDFDTAEALVDQACCVVNGRVRPIPKGGPPLRERYRQALAEVTS